MQTQGKIPATPGEEQEKKAREKFTLGWEAHQAKKAYLKNTGAWKRIGDAETSDIEQASSITGSITSSRPEPGKEVEEGFYVKGPHKVHVYKNAKGGFSISYAPPPEVHLTFSPFPFTVMSGLSLGKMAHDESDSSLSGSQPTNKLSIPTMLAVAAVGFTFGPLVVPMMPFLPFLVQNDYAAYLNAKAVEFTAYKQILGTDTIILDWKGTVNRDILDKLFDIAESLGMRIEIPEGSSLRTQLEGNFKHDSKRGILHYEARIKELNTNAEIFALQRNADNTKGATDSADLLNKQEKLEKQFPESDLTDEERQEKYEASLIKDEKGGVKEGVPLVDSLGAATTDLEKRLMTVQEEMEKQRRLIKSFDDLVKEPEKMAKELPKKLSLPERTLNRIRGKQVELKDKAKGIALLQNRVSAMEEPMNDFIKASDDEIADIKKRLEVIKRQLTAAKQAATDDPRLKAAQAKLIEAKNRLDILEKGGSEEQKTEKQQEIRDLQAELAQQPDKNSEQAQALQSKLTQAEQEADILQKGGTDEQIQEKKEQIAKLEGEAKQRPQTQVATKVDEQLKKITEMEEKFINNKNVKDEKEAIKARFSKGKDSYAAQLNQLAQADDVESHRAGPGIM